MSLWDLIPLPLVLREGGKPKPPAPYRCEECQQERKPGSCSPAGCWLSVVRNFLGKPGGPWEQGCRNMETGVYFLAGYSQMQEA